MLFDLTYEDGSRCANRKALGKSPGDWPGVAPSRAEIKAQDRRIALASGRLAQGIVTLVRSARI